MDQKPPTEKPACAACRGTGYVNTQGRRNGKPYRRRVRCMKCGPEALSW